MICMFTALAATPAFAVPEQQKKAALAMAEQGSKAFQAGNMVKAAEQYLLAARTDPEEPNYLFGAARAEHSARQFDAAELHYRAFALTANADPTRVAKVKQYLAEIRTERAGERAAEAQALTQKGDSMLAASTWLEAYQLAQDRPQYLLQAALAERQAGDPAACLAHLDAYLRVAPADAPERAKAQSLVSQMRKSSGTTPTPAPAGEPQAKPTPVQPTPTPEPVAGGVLPAPVETVTSPADPPRFAQHPHGRPVDDDRRWWRGHRRDGGFGLGPL